MPNFYRLGNFINFIRAWSVAPDYLTEYLGVIQRIALRTV
jgi:predicted acyltransferase